MLFWKAVIVAVLGLSATAFAAPQAPKGSPKGAGGKRSSDPCFLFTEHAY
jgi:hypothetical protein